MTTVLAWMSSPDFLPILYFLCTVFGVAATHVFSIHQGLEGSATFLKQHFPGYDDVFYRRLDFLLSLLFGSIIGTILFAPSNVIEAFAAGVGWDSAFNTLINQMKK
jgi:hypothetical protein